MNITDITDIKLSEEFTFEKFINYYSGVSNSYKGKIPTTLHYLNAEGKMVTVLLQDAPPEVMKQGIQAILKKHKVEAYFMQCQSLVDFPEKKLTNIDSVWYAAVNKYRMICDYHVLENGVYKHSLFESIITENFEGDERPYLLDLLYYDKADDNIIGGDINV